MGGLDYLEPVAGGAARQDSVRNGLEGLASSAPDYVLVHDAARPMVAPALIDRVIEALQDTSGVIPGIAVVDTLKRADDDGIITDTVSRDGLWRAQTPQGFKYADLLAAHRSAIGQELTDDAAVMEASGYRVAVVLGDENNIKVTTPDDLMRMEEIMSDDSAQAKLVRSPSFRIGSGYDVHKLGPGDHGLLGPIYGRHNHCQYGMTAILPV